MLSAIGFCGTHMHAMLQLPWTHTMWMVFLVSMFDPATQRQNTARCWHEMEINYRPTHTHTYMHAPTNQAMYYIMSWYTRTYLCSVDIQRAEYASRVDQMFHQLCHCWWQISTSLPQWGAPGKSTQLMWRHFQLWTTIILLCVCMGNRNVLL